jgi:phosphoglycolate phosphatase
LPKPRLIAVDLDGTLVDSAPDIAFCLDRALEAVGFAAPGEARVRGWIGDGIETLIARALAHAAPGDGAREDHRRPSPGADVHAAALAAFLRLYRDNLFVRSALYPDALATLDALAARGSRLCCITNKRFSFSEALLRRAGAAPRLELLIGGDSLAEKKPSPLPLLHAAETLGVAPADAVLVGDSHQDLHAARAAGFGFVFASYGYGKVSPDELGAAPRIGAFAELATLFAA